MVNKISIFVLLFFFVTHATGMNSCIFKMVYLSATEISSLNKDTAQSQPTTIDPEEEAKEEAYPTEDYIVIQIPDRNITNIHTFDTFSISNFLLEIVSPPPEA